MRRRSAGTQLHPQPIQLIPSSEQPAVATLIASVADIAAPGSKLFFDFLHADAVDGSEAYPGYEACSQVRWRVGGSSGRHMYSLLLSCCSASHLLSRTADLPLTSPPPKPNLPPAERGWQGRELRVRTGA